MILQMQYLMWKPLMAIPDNGSCPACDVFSAFRLWGTVGLRVDAKMSCALQIHQWMMGTNEHLMFIRPLSPREDTLSSMANAIFFSKQRIWFSWNPVPKFMCCCVVNKPGQHWGSRSVARAPAEQTQGPKFQASTRNKGADWRCFNLKLLYTFF